VSDPTSPIHALAARWRLLAPLAVLLFSGVLSNHRPAAHAQTVGTGVISLVLRAQLAGQSMGTVAPRMRAGLLPIVVESTRDPSAAIRALGGTVTADAGGRVTAASLPPNRLQSLARVPGVTALFPSDNLSRELDSGVVDIGANRAWSLRDSSGLPLQGDHVLIGFVDSGIDVHNPDFQNPDGTTRIKYLWDQTGAGAPPAGFDFGSECTAATIDANHCGEVDIDGHGTHVAGIAAGNGRSDPALGDVGVAPHADIIAVKAPLTTVDVLAAWQYMIQKAQQLGEPIVINNSFGMTEGPHDGSEPLAQAIDALSGPGRIFVKSAGNAGNTEDHARTVIRQGKTATISVKLAKSPGKDQFELFAFYPIRARASVKVTDANTGQSTAVVPQDEIAPPTTLQADGSQVAVLSSPYNTTYNEVVIDIVAPAGTHTYNVALRGTRVAGSARVDAWLPEGGLASFRNQDATETLTVPADAHSAIVVGSYVTSASWTATNGKSYNLCTYPRASTAPPTCDGGNGGVSQVDGFSSAGPTASGQQKPDIVAPGAVIASSLTGDATVCGGGQVTDCIPKSTITPDGKHLMLFGTSIAAPHVTGTIALMLQADPSLDPTAVDGILRGTARHDASSGNAAWNPIYGAGKLDTYAAVEHVLSGDTPATTGVASTPAFPDAAAVYLREVDVDVMSRYGYQLAGHLVRGQSAALTAVVEIGGVPSETARWHFRFASGTHTILDSTFTKPYAIKAIGGSRITRRTFTIPWNAPRGTYTFTATLAIGSSVQTLVRRITVT
jgi:subtilisin family serine protease